jgi:general nucleoside transport system permease protein
VVIIGRWTPLGAFLGALLFAFFDSLGLRAQSGMAFIATELFSILPYAMTLLVLMLTARSKVAPRAL